ncbi:hypothetical protein ACJRO7_026746 [Eucalyptus globulus]|uniref:WAT1-related protein n=1 Tax=Eucalyptus globulus TaxID=34317 RepID=A0ABD3JRL2_EUCGL
MMVVVQILLAVINILCELEANDGMDLMLALAYGLIIAMGVMGPLAFFLERALAGRSILSSKALGTLTGVGGPMLLTLYNGVEVDLLSALPRGSCNRLLGSLLAAKMSEGFPYHYTSTALMCFMGERIWSQWKLGSNIGLLIVLYSVLWRIIASGVCNVLILWCLGMGGPVFVSVFNPLMMVTVALGDPSFWTKSCTWEGIILGAGLIILGLYAALGAKEKRWREWISQCHRQAPAPANLFLGIAIRRV